MLDFIFGSEGDNKGVVFDFLHNLLVDVLNGAYISASQCVRVIPQGGHIETPDARQSAALALASAS